MSDDRPEMDSGDWKIVKGILLVLCIVIVVTTLNPVVFVGAGERGALMEWGRVVPDRVLEPGMHIIMPVYNSVAKLDVQTQVYESEASAASKDLQDAKTKVALNYHIDPTCSNILYRDIGKDYRNKVIMPAVTEVVKAVTAQFNADELITKRSDVKEKTHNSLFDRLVSRCIIVEQLSITDFAFSPQFTASIERKVTQLQDALTAENKLKQIEFEAKQKIATAEGDKQSRILNAEGQAREIEIIQSQLDKSPKYIAYLATRQWNGELPKVTGNAIPFINIPLEEPKSQ